MGTKSIVAGGMVGLLVALSACADTKRFAYNGFGGRDRWQQPERVIRVLEIKPGDHVADVGAGGGYFTFRLADAVGPTGKVYAVDVDEALLERLAEDAASGGYANVETVLADPDDPRLPATELDMIFTSNTVHHIPDRSAYFRHAARYLDDGGRVAIIDYHGAGRGLQQLLVWLSGHFVSGETVRQELDGAGYRVVGEHDFLARQSFLVFTRGSAGS